MFQEAGDQSMVSRYSFPADLILGLEAEKCREM